MNKHEVESKSDATVTLKFSVCYIVAAVVIKDEKVLMIQEAKRSCRGSWYLPAGRLEPGETLYEGVQREVLEETGHTFVPEALTLVEVHGNAWYRFTFTGTINGGKLKTLENADKESLQSAWLDLDMVLNGRPRELPYPLRGTDIRICIKATQDCHSRGLTNWAFLPSTSNDHRQIHVKCLFVRSKKSKEVLITSDGEVIPYFQLVVNNGRKTFRSVLDHFVTATFNMAPSEIPSTIPYFVIDVEHSGKLNKDGSCDGIIITVFGEIPASVQEPSSNSAFFWKSLDETASLSETIKKKIRHEAPGAILDAH